MESSTTATCATDLAARGLADAIQAEVVAALADRLTGPRFHRVLDGLAEDLISAVTKSLKQAAGTKAEQLLGDGLVKTPEAMEFLSCGKDTLEKLMDDGSIPYVQYDRFRRIPKRALIEFAQKHLID